MDIKEIIFNNNEMKVNANSQNDIENIIFNNLNSNNLNKFVGEENIVLEEEIAIKDVIYKNDIVYLKELQNQLLSEYPVNKYSDKYIQEKVENEAKKIIEVKNYGLEINNMIQNGIEYKFIENTLDNNFDNQIIIPVVLDKHKIFVKLKDENISKNDDQNNEQENLNIYFSESLEDKNGIIQENQKSELIKLKELFHNKAIGNLEYKKYINDINDLSRPYILNIDKLGFIIKPKNQTLLLRYNDIDNIHWNTHTSNNDYIILKDLYDEKGKIKGIENSVLLKGDDINVVGFILLASNKILEKNFIEIGEISKISNSQNGIDIDCESHGLKDNDTIYIDNTDTFPPLNNVFNKSITIINQNKFRLNINIKLIKEGTYGKLYKLSKLNFDKYNIIKSDNNELSIILKESTYSEKEINNNHNKLYLFDNINKNNYQDIIKTILPSLNTIVQDNMIKLKQALTYDDVSEIFKDYNITINDLDITQAIIIKNILKNNLDKLINLINSKSKYSNNININNKNFNSDYFLSNTFITDSDIENIYGKYPHFGKPEDNNILRINWIENKNDNGRYYYLNYLLKKNNNITLDYVLDKKKELTQLLKELDKNFKKEKNTGSNNISRPYKFKAYIVSDKDIEDSENSFKKLQDILENILKDGTILFYKDNLYLWQGKLKKDKLIKFENLDENTIVLVGDQLWVWQKGIWSKSIATPKYDNIHSLCALNNIDLADIKLDSLDCIYRKEFGCHTKFYIRLQENIIKIQDSLNKFEKIEESLKNTDDNIKNEMEKIKIQYFSKINSNYTVVSNKSNNNSKNNKINLIKNKVDSLSILLKLINNIENNDIRLNYIYSIIDKDGITIDNKVYSKKYKRNINICGHYIFFKKINYANSPNEKLKLIDEMFSLYSDNGYSDKEVHICKYCGEMIGTNEYDDTEGFSETGMIKKSRELWKIEKLEEREKFNLFDFLKISELDELSLKEVLLENGLNIDDIDDAISITLFITKNLFIKSGVSLSNQDIINIVIDSLQKIRLIIPYTYHKSIYIKKMKEKGLSQMKIDEMEKKNIFKHEYDKHYKLQRSSIITARFLISVQTNIPHILRSSKTTICPFYSFDYHEGITYMACILNEMKIIETKDKTISIENLKKNILDEYEKYKELYHIKKLFSERKLYDIELSKKIDTLKFKIDNKNEIELEKKLDERYKVEPIKIDTEFNELIMKNIETENINKLHDVLLNRLYFLSRNIRKTVKEVISSSALSNIYSGILESSCCTENADSYLGYYYYIENESSRPIAKYIDESNLIYPYIQYFVDKGSIHKFVLYDKYKYNGIYNKPIVDDEINTSESLIKDVFKIFIDTGVFAGQMREYVGNVNNPIDIKSGLSYNEIMSKTYTIEQYQGLLKNIEKHNIKYYVDDKKIYFEKSELNEMKKNSYDLLDKEIQSLVKNVATVLQKDKEFIDKYINVLRNIGIFKNDAINNSNNKTDREKIKAKSQIIKQKLDYIKTFYISKFIKYLSIIKFSDNKLNKNININFADNSDIELDIQKIIFEENNRLAPFLDDNVRKYFMNIESKYTNDEINSINGMDNIYNSKFDKIKKYSDFNFNDASNVLLYILLQELNNLISCSIQSNKNDFLNDEGKSVNLYNIDEKNSKCYYMCNFIILLFENIDEDNELFNFCNSSVEKIKNSLRHDIIEYQRKNYFKDDTAFMLQNIQTERGSYAIDEIDEETEKEFIEHVDKINEENKLEFIMNKGKKELLKHLGHLPTEDQLESFKSDYLKNSEDDLMYEKEAYDLDSTAKGQDVLDQGADYGGFNDYDFETGDGFDYSDQQDEM